MTIDRLIGEGDVVGCQMTFTARHLGPWSGVEPTGRQVTFGGMAFDRVVGGQRVGHAGVGDVFGLLRQLGPR